MAQSGCIIVKLELGIVVPGISCYLIPENSRLFSGESTRDEKTIPGISGVCL